MSDQSQLERRYRRLLAWYPSAFRREHGQEMLAVLLACARDGRRRPGVADTFDLLWHALWLRIAPTTRRSLPAVFWGVRLMLLAAFLELVALVVVVVSRGAVNAAVLRHASHLDPAHLLASVHGQVLSVELGAPVATAAWLVLAWANDRGRRWGRVGAVGMLVLNSVSLLAAVSRHAASYAPADLVAGIALCAAALAAAALIISAHSNGHYDKSQRDGGPNHADADRGSGFTRRPRPDFAGWN